MFRCGFPFPLVGSPFGVEGPIDLLNAPIFRCLLGNRAAIALLACVSRSNSAWIRQRSMLKHRRALHGENIAQFSDVHNIRWRNDRPVPSTRAHAGHAYSGTQLLGRGRRRLLITTATKNMALSTVTSSVSTTDAQRNHFHHTRVCTELRVTNACGNPATQQPRWLPTTTT